MKYTNYQQIVLRLNETMLTQLAQDVPGLIHSTQAATDNLVVRTTGSKLRAVAVYLRNSTQLQFRTLVDIAVVDRLLPHGRFAVNYLFLSMITNQRVTVQVFANETSTLPSLAVPFGRQRFFASAL